MGHKIDPFTHMPQCELHIDITNLTNIKFQKNLFKEKQHLRWTIF